MKSLRERERFKTNAARQAAAIEIAAAKFCRHIATVQHKKPTRSNKATLSQSRCIQRRKASAATKRPANNVAGAGPTVSYALENLQPHWMRNSQQINDGKAGRGTLLFRLSARAGLHVVQRAAPPASEPCPIAVDIVARAVIPTCVEQPMSVATTSFTAVGFIFFYPGTALFLRLLTCFFVSHNCSPFVWSSFLLRSHITRCDSGRYLMSGHICGSKRWTLHEADSLPFLLPAGLEAPTEWKRWKPPPV